MGNLIYHFTGANALKSIVLSQTFWITKSDYLNDKTELHGIRPLLQRFFKQSTKMGRQVQNYITQRLDYYQNEYNYYILSCSSADDSLPLWNYYSELEGYSIGLDKKEFIDSFERYFQSMDQDAKIMIAEVEYITEGDDSAIRERLLPVSLFSDNDLDAKKDVLDELALELANLSLSMKHMAYAAEKEVRIVVVCKKESAITQNEEFRVLNGSFIPYIIFNKEQLPGFIIPIKKFKLSPYLTMDLTRQSVLYLANRKYKGINDEDVLMSNIPSRY